MKRTSEQRGAVARLSGALAAISMCCTAACGCSPRTLVLVDSREAGTPGIDAPVGPDQMDAADASPPTTLTNGLVGLWHLDDGTGSAVAHDSSGNRNDGTLIFPATSNPWADGRIGSGALDTAGVGYASVAQSDSINGIVSQVTMSAWIYYVGPVPIDYATAISRQIGATIQQRYHLSVYLDGTPNVFVQTTMLCQAGGPAAAATTNGNLQPVPRSAWTHLASTFDGAQVLLYVNGAVVASTPCTGTFPAETTPVILGGNGNNRQVTELFPGLVDEIILYNRALTPDEIQQLANGVTF